MPKLDDFSIVIKAWVLPPILRTNSAKNYANLPLFYREQGDLYFSFNYATNY